MAVSRRLRFEILRRDGNACRYCGAMAPDVPLTVDHVVPVALGGSDDPTNLVTACAPCNGGKSSVPADAPLVADVRADALRWGKAMEYVISALEGDVEYRMKLNRDFDAMWTHWWWKPRGEEEPLPRPADWRENIVRFAGLGITEPMFKEFVDIAMRKNLGADTWRYFCGCCWRTLDTIQDRTRDVANLLEVLDSED